jgi:membrane protein
VSTTAARRSAVRDRVREIVSAFEEHDLLTYASAISFQILSALVPFLLFAVSLMGFLQLEEVWRSELAPQIKPTVSAPAFQVMNDAVENALSSKQVFWLTAGFVLALWQVSGAIRAVMGALNTIYRQRSRRSWARRMLVSTALGLAVGACFLLAIAVVTLPPLLYDDVSAPLTVLLTLARWGAAGAFLLLAVGLLLHLAPERHQPLQWVTFGSLLIIVSWLVMSALFGLYLTKVASYASVFGPLATVVVLMGYLYVSAVIFLGGVQVDALVRVEAQRD